MLKKRARGLMCLMLAACLAACCAWAAAETCEYGIYEIQDSGNITLKVYGNTFHAQGFDYGDLIDVTYAGLTYRMPVCSSYSDVDSGEMVCRMKLDDDITKSAVVLAVNGGDFHGTVLADVKADPKLSAPGDDATIAVAMAEKGGYAEEYALRQLEGSNVRADYPDLTDAEYANFRMVQTSGIAPHTLYRSSSPIDPSLNRSREADEALNEAGIESIINLTDGPGDLAGYEGYGQTYYSQRKILALKLTANFDSPSFRAGFAALMRFIGANEGPYLVHCKLGKDRTGFVCGVLECLMGAAADEIVADYMQSYVCYYHLSANDEKYKIIANSNIVPHLEKALGVPDLYAADADLAGAAERYFRGVGLTDAEIEAARRKLSGQN